MTLVSRPQPKPADSAMPAKAREPPRQAIPAGAATCSVAGPVLSGDISDSWPRRDNGVDTALVSTLTAVVTQGLPPWSGTTPTGCLGMTG